MRKKLTLFIFLLFAGLTAALAQSTIRGKVTDKAGQPLPGVSVKIKGSSEGTTSDLNGMYSINAAPTATLTFTFVGFSTQDVAINSRTSVDVTLSDDVRALDEVVVIGYGSQKKSVVTGAISSVKASDLENQQVVNITDALKGRTSGVVAVQGSGQPGSTATIRVRGITSINNSEPLYVIDGIVVLNGGIENINPNDIQSIEVLKDASAAIYGSRASAGVVLVTTKKGKSGEPSLTYNNYIGVQNVVKKVEMANATQYATLRNQAAANDGKPTAPFANPSQFGEGTNWQDQIFGSAMIQNHTLALQGGTDKSTYYTSFGYINQQGIVLKDASNYKRYNFTVNSTVKPKKWLNIGENFQYAYTRSQGISTNSEFGGPLSSALNLDPITPAVVTNISAQPNDKVYTNNAALIIRDANGNPYGISNYVQNEITNPLAFIQTIKGNYGFSHNILGSAFAEITPIKGLSFKTQINGKQSFYGSQSFTPLYYLNVLLNNSTNPNAYRQSNRNLTWNWDNTASYTKMIGDHNFSVLVGTSAQESTGVSLGAQFNNLPNIRADQLSFNFTLPNASKIANSGEDQPYHTASIFGRVTYDYQEKYLFTGIIRRDGSSKFGSNNVYGTFPSASVGWVVSKEGFFPKNDALSYFKLRGSYGIVGNEQSLRVFQFTSVVGGGRNYVFGNDGLTVGNSPLSPANPNLKWEEVRTADIGFDAVLFNNLSVTVDLYRKLTKGMIQGVPLPGYAGFDDRYFDNVGNLENKGIELELGYNKTFGKFRMSLNGNISYNKNNVSYLGLTPFYDEGGFQNTTYAIYRTTVGQPVQSFYGFNTTGIFQSQAEINAYAKNGTPIQPNAKPGDLKYEDINNDGKIGQEDRKFLGNQLPKWTYGFNFNGNYGNFDVKIFGQGVWGNKLYQGYRRLDISTANYMADALNAWTPTNTNTDHPRLTVDDPNKNYSNPSNWNLQSGAYFRVKTAQIGYSIPKNLLTKIDVNRIRIYVSSNNLFTITKYNGFDPEIAGGIDRGIYPQSRSFLVGLDVTL